MQAFEYRGLSSSGKKTKGFIQALSIQDAKELLRAEKILYTDIRILSNNSVFHKKPRSPKQKEIVVLLEQLSQMLDAHISIYDALCVLEKQYQRSTLFLFISSVRNQVQEGASLSKALQTTSLLPYYAQALIHIGEETGNIAITLSQLVAVLKKQYQLKQSILTALLYPTVLGVVACGVFLVMLIFVIPSLEEFFEERPLNMLTNIMFTLSHLIRHGWLYILGLLISVGYGCRYIYRAHRIRVVHWIANLPGIRSFLSKKAALTFSHTLALLLQGGISMQQALSLTIKVLPQSKINEDLANLSHAVIEGHSLSQAIEKVACFPDFVSKMIRIGEESGKLDLMLSKTATLLEEDLSTSLERILTLLQPAILLVMGILIGLIMLSMIIPLTDTSHFLLQESI